MHHTQFTHNNPPHAPQIHIPTGNGALHGLTISKLILRKVSGCHDLTYRPFNSTLTHETVTDFQNHLDGGINGITPSTMSGFASNIIRPVAVHHGIVPIANGWGEDRMLFMMEVINNTFGGATERIVLSGFTDYAGITQNKTIDRRMRFYFNNVIKLQEIRENSAVGSVISNRLIDSSQMIYENPFGPAGFSSPVVATMRPTDVFETMQHNYLPGVVLDMRQGFKTEPIKLSKRINTVTTNYVGTIISNLSHAIRSSELDNNADFINTIAAAKENSRERKVRADSFLVQLSRVSSFSQGKSISYGELLEISPDLDDRVTAIISGRTQMSNQPMYQNTQHWGGSDISTVTATTLAHSVPSLMMGCMLTNVSFTAHNLTIDRSFDVKMTAAPAGYSSGMDIVGLANTFIHRLITEVLNDLSRNGQFSLSFTMACDVFGQSSINISWNGEQPIPFMIPSFCDALISPIASNSQAHLDIIANDMTSLCSSIGLDQSSTAGTNYDLSFNL